MKKIFAIIMAMLLFAVPATALCSSWANPIPSSTASPFSVEVIKLIARTDATGGRYYAQIAEYEAYNDSTIYYCIKLSLPSYSEANAYYATGDLYSGSRMKVVIDYENVANKDREVVYATLTDRPQTLYYNGASFASVSGHNYVLSALQTKDRIAKITASVVGKGSIDDIVIGNTYRVKRQAYYGVQPCVNCNPTNLVGYLVYGAHAAHDVFLSASNGKLSGIYVIDQHQSASYSGAKVRIEQPLFRWVQNGLYTGYDGAQYPTYGLQELFYGTRFDRHAGTLIEQKSDGYFQQYCGAFAVKQELRDVNGVYYMDADGLYRRVMGAESFWRTQPHFYLDDKTYAEYGDTEPLAYGNIYYDVAAYTETAIHQMTSPAHVNEDTYEKDYLNSANHVLGLLGLSFADVGVAYMSDDLWLENFGFKASQTSSADWAVVTQIPQAQIITIPVAEVPETGDHAMLAVVLCCAGIFCMCMSVYRWKP